MDRSRDESPRRSGSHYFENLRAPAESDTVLVVEDDPGQRDALTRMFELEGLKVVAVGNGLEGLEKVRAHDFLAIVCDIRMPETSGFGFFDQLEESYPHLASRVIFVSAYTADPEIEDYIRRTGQPFIGKPYDVHALIATVRKVMEKAG
jgi:CheY-like chemotaxis protein